MRSPSSDRQRTPKVQCTYDRLNIYGLSFGTYYRQCRRQKMVRAEKIQKMPILWWTNMWRLLEERVWRYDNQQHRPKYDYNLHVNKMQFCQKISFLLNINYSISTWQSETICLWLSSTWNCQNWTATSFNVKLHPITYPGRKGLTDISWYFLIANFWSTQCQVSIVKSYIPIYTLTKYS